MTREFLNKLILLMQEMADEAVSNHFDVEHNGWDGSGDSRLINELRTELEAMCDEISPLIKGKLHRKFL